MTFGCGVIAVACTVHPAITALARTARMGRSVIGRHVTTIRGSDSKRVKSVELRCWPQPASGDRGPVAHEVEALVAVAARSTSDRRGSRAGRNRRSGATWHVN